MCFHTQELVTPDFYKLLLSHLGGQENKFRLRNPRVLLALEHTFLICEFQFEDRMAVEEFMTSLNEKTWEPWPGIIPLNSQRLGWTRYRLRLQGRNESE